MPETVNLNAKIALGPGETSEDFFWGDGAEDITELLFAFCAERGYDVAIGISKEEDDDEEA